MRGEDFQSYAIHAIISGRVQGVSFRYYTLLRANELEVMGWVRNLSDGTVEVLAEGSQTQLEHLVTFLNTGPIGARVERVVVHWPEATNQFTDFSIR